MRIFVGLLLYGAIAISLPSRALGQRTDSSATRQSTDDAWWTGPMLAPSPNTLPPGHFLVEPYIFDVRTPHTNGFGSLTYINYGLANNFTVGPVSYTHLTLP